MLIISCRKHFRDTDALTNGHGKIMHLSPRNSSNGTKVSWNDLPTFISDKRILLLVHGYDNRFDEMMEIYDCIDKKQKKWIKVHNHAYYDMVVGYAWPGSTGYNKFDRAWGRVPYVVPKFVFCLKALNRCAKEVHIMSHSLGCQISLAAYSQIGKNNLCKKNRQFLMAAAVEQKSVENGGENFIGSYCTQSCHIFYNLQDGIFSFQKHVKYPLGVYGPKRSARIGIHGNLSRRTYGIDCQNVLASRNGHSGYRLSLIHI